MIELTGKTVYLSCGYTDMRKSINGLAAIVGSSFNLDPFSDIIFAFCNRNRDRLKILEWDGGGFWLYFKCLEKDHLKWPAEDDNPAMPLSGEELATLFHGAKLELKTRRKSPFEYDAI